ncbi:M48 family metalloprotease [Phenylobacterium sp.]|uniref:M48 family metalloprotease n=1 Tax=Phenylobacterium sp. TaxID=1871053 RepID=UPI0025DE021F|nr:M48 family metalloprotease [Phenylobacterium sp.]
MTAKRAAAALALTVLALPAAAQAPRAAQAERRQQGEVLRSVGGAYEGPQAAYVQRIGERMAVAAGLGGRCAFAIVNSQVVNAFTTPPGCYVYVTRGLLGIMNSEAELAAVLGHELGHVAANHAQRQQNQEAITGLAAALVGAVARSDVVGAVAGRAAKLGSLGYSRSQEYEADSLAIRYLPLAGYAPRGLADVLDDLQREDQFSARATGRDARAMPVWASTHPLTADRIRRAAQQGEATPPGAASDLNAQAYLSALDGLAYGDDPNQGAVNGQSFVHPGLRIAFEAPPGFQLTNAVDAVRITGPDGLRGEFAAGRASSVRLEDYAAQVLQGVVGQTPVETSRPRRTTINGLDAVILQARAQTRGGPMEVLVAAYAMGGDRAYHFATITPDGQGAVFDPMYGSFHLLSEHEAATLGTRRIAVVTARSGDTSESLAAGMAGPDRLDRFLMLNALQRGEPLSPGRRVKLVVAGGG